MQRKIEYWFLTITLFILFYSVITFGQVKYDWKEMASLDVYNLTADKFWNCYSQNKSEIWQNIRRAKKLGFNIVRIPLNFVQQNIDPSHPYDHGWVDSTQTKNGSVIVNGIGSGMVFTHSTQYVNDINELINFIFNDQKMKIDLMLFNHGGKNQAGQHVGDIYNNYYCVWEGSSTWLDDGNETNWWFKDATAWINYILSHIDLTKIEVCELRNEAYPQDNIDLLSYPGYFHDRFLLEMTNYLNHRWPQIKLMISITQENNVQRFTNLSDMIRKAWNNGQYNGYTRPTWMNYDNNLYTRYDSVFFDYLSFHNYNTYSYRKAFQDVLNIYGGELQPNHGYQWHLGEIGFDIGTSNSYEADQAKFFQSDLQIIDQFYESLKTTSHALKGVGIWSVFDYNYSGEPGARYGLISSGTNPVRKRKAAYVVENYFEGLVDNPNFEIGTANDTNFNDSPWCNGWTAWYATGQNYVDSYYAPRPPTVTGYLQLNPAPTSKIGWSSEPGGWIRVKPTTMITLKAKIKISSYPGSSSKIYVLLSWANADGQWIGSSSETNLVNKYSYNTWQDTSITVTVPSNAYYTAPYLRADYSNTSTQFSNVSLIPEWRPLISFTFGNDIQYFPVGENQNGPIGWRTFSGNASRNNNILSLTGNTRLRSTTYIDANQVCGIRMKQQRNYSVGAYAFSSSAQLQTYTLINEGVSDYPGSNFDNYSATPINGSTWRVIETPTTSSNIRDWLEIQMYDLGSGTTQFKELTVFEKTVANPFNKSANESQNISPSTFKVDQNYPNPFNPSTNISYSIPEISNVKIVVIDVLGREIQTLVNKEQQIGHHEVTFDASKFSSGVYYYRIQAGNFVQTKKMLLLK